MLYAVRRGVGERRASLAIAALPKAKPEQQAGSMAAIAQQFLDIDSYLPAESWLQSARNALAASANADPAAKQRVDSISQALVQAKISVDLAAVI
jgi:hypothetical protein